MTDTFPYEKLPLPKSWHALVRSAVLHSIALAHAAVTHVRGMCLDSRIARLRLAARLDRAEAEIARLHEETRIKDSRMAAIDPRRRPHYPPVERMAILEMRASCGWSLQQTADVFLVSKATVSMWTTRLTDEGPKALVQLRFPVNRFPDLVRYLVQRLKGLCPFMGKKKIAQTLARAGLHLAATTVGRILREEPSRPAVAQPVKTPADKSSGRVVTAEYPNHLWHLDLTAVPIVAGFWAPWLPRALPQCWPFCWWVLAVVDHYSRRVQGLAVFRKNPSSGDICAFLSKLVIALGRGPRHIVTDRGKQFDCDCFRGWCFPHILNRYGAIGKYGSIAVVERFMRTLKDQHTRRILVPMNIDRMKAELGLFARWYNAERTHEFLDGRTPDEVYHGRAPANAQPRWEPRPKWPRSSPCAAPQAPVRGPCGARLKLVIHFQGQRRHLPVVKLRRIA